MGVLPRVLYCLRGNSYCALERKGRCHGIYPPPPSYLLSVLRRLLVQCNKLAVDIDNEVSREWAKLAVDIDNEVSREWAGQALVTEEWQR